MVLFVLLYITTNQDDDSLTILENTVVGNFHEIF